MMSAKTFLRSLAAFSTLTASLTALIGAQTRVLHHPLDALTTDEYWTVHDVLVQSGHLTEKTLFSSVLLHEPVKDRVLAWKEGDSIPREADVILEDQGKTIEARVDIPARKLEFWKQVPGVQAPITETELDTLASSPRSSATAPPTCRACAVSPSPSPG
jgi:primary-amine oxidase